MKLGILAGLTDVKANPGAGSLFTAGSQLYIILSAADSV
jgi:hypothetical protein